MKKFGKRLFVFLIPLLLLFVGTVVLRDVQTKKTSKEFSFDRYVNKVVIGDSHIANGIDDNLLNNTKNIAIGGEGLIYSLNKIKLLNENRVKLDTVYLGVSYHTFSDYFDIYIFDHYYLDKYFYTLPYSTQKYFLGEINKPANFFLKNVLRNLKGLVLQGINLDEMMGGTRTMLQMSR